MKKLQHIFVTFCLILFFSFTASAQPQINWGSNYKLEGNVFGIYYTNFDLAGGDENNYYVVKSQQREDNLLKFDFTHKLESSTPFSFEFNGKNLFLERFITTKSKTFGIFSNYDKKKNIFSIQAAELEGGKFMPIKEVALQPYKVQYKFIAGFGFAISGYTDKDVTGSFAISADKKYVATIRTLSSKESGQADEISVIVFDENMNVKWQKIQDFPYKDKQLDVQDFIVSNTGDVFLAVTLDLPKKEKEKGLPYYNYQVIKITENDYKEYKLTVPGNNVISSAGLFISPKENEINIGGFCKDKDRETDGDNSLFYLKLDLATGSLATKVYPFSKEFLDGITRKKSIEDGDGVFGFKIKDIVTFSDNSFSFIAEKSYSYLEVRTSNGVKTSTPVYVSDEIIIARFESNGDLKELVKLDKDFRSATSGRTSYVLGIKNDKLFLLYNDSKSREEGVEEKKGSIFTVSKYKLKNAYTTLSIINSNGKLESQETIFSGAETEGIFYPSNSKQIGDKLIIGISTLKSFHFGTLTLE